MDAHHLDTIETQKDLQAAVAARRELHPEFEDQVLEAFLARVESRIDRRVNERMETARPARGTMRGEPVQIEVIAAIFGLAIPLLAIAEKGAGTWGTLAVMIGVIAVSALYFIDRWVRFS